VLVGILVSTLGRRNMQEVEPSSETHAFQIYKAMSQIRIAETLAAEYYLSNKIFSFVHFCVGQEFAPAAFGHFASEGDRAFGNHRSHGHFLGMGGSAYEMFSEMLGKASGTSSGKGGSMHLLDPKVGFSGTSPILSSALPIAAGSAWNQKLNESQGLTIVYTGDGASEEGNFYETLNVATLWNLPLIIVVENNLYSVNSPAKARRGSEFSMEKLVRSFGMEYYFADGTDPLSSIEVLEKCYMRTKLQRTPAVIEVRAYRHLAHSSPLTDDAIGYRQEDTDTVRATHDPILKLREYLLEKGKSVEELEKAWTALETQLLQDLQRAAASQDPNPSELARGLYA
jgi:TPP-dependent pyruvate/acetoin dehydrogenase alpha subunit